MKRYFIMFTMLFLCFNNVNAFSSWNDEMPSNLKNIELETEVRYKWYENITEDIYDLYDEDKLKYIDYSDTKETDYSDLSEDFPEVVPYRKIDSVEEPIELDTNIMNSLRLLYFGKALNEKETLTEIKVINKKTSKPIIFTIDAKKVENIELQNVDKLQDGNLVEDAYEVVFNSVFIIKFEEFVPISDVQLIVYFKSFNSEMKYFFVQFMHDGKYNITRTIKEYYTNTYDLPNQISNVVISKSEGEWTINNSFIKRSYKYKDVLFKYHVPGKKYLDDYYKEKDGYIKDESTAKVFYRYKAIEPEIEKKIIYDYKTIEIPKIKEFANNDVLDVDKTKNNKNSNINDDNIIGTITNDKTIALASKNKLEKNNNKFLYCTAIVLIVLIMCAVIKIFVDKRKSNY